MYDFRGEIMDTQDNRAYRCINCDQHWYYRKPSCPKCNSETVESYTLDTAVVLSTTTVHATPKGVRSPNHLAFAQFENVNVVAQVANGIAELTTGDRVRFSGRHNLRENKTETIRGARLIKI